MANQAAGVHEICDHYVDEVAAEDPVAATEMGVPGHDDRLTDYSPDGYAARAETTRRALRRVGAATTDRAGEEAAQEVFAERSGTELELHEAGLDVSQLNPIASPVQALRMVFDLMPTETEDDWATVSRRLRGVPAGLDGVRTSLLAAAEVGRSPALRQISTVAEQAETWSGMHGDSGYFTNLISGAAGVPESLAGDLERNAHAAQEAYAELAGFLRAELAPRAPAKDAVGEDVYRLWSRYFTGSDIDPREAYEWGWEEFRRVEAEAHRVAERIRPGAGLAGVAAQLDGDERYQVHGQAALREWMQRLADEALHSLRDTHFEIPEPLMGLECRIAPPGGGLGAYYTGPSEDFSRPGRMWWSIAPEQTAFSTWREVSTVYHEGVPGHHLQVATSVHEPTLNRFQRMMAFTSGHAEGWALYAERLMQELGYLSDDANLLGMLDAHLFRAARVIIDIGMHLELEIPRGSGFHEGEVWTPELGLEFLTTRTLTQRAYASDEIDRYLGWPGQASAYKLGERAWLGARQEAQRSQGDEFDIKEFHTRALRLGGMGLDTLRDQLSR